jgi:hypothetical protein
VHPRPVVRKRAIITLAQFVPISQGYLVTDLLATHVFPFLASNANLEKQRTTVQLVAAVARTAPTQIAPVLGEIVPGVLKAVQRDDDELREGSLQVGFIFECLSSVITRLDAGARGPAVALSNGDRSVRGADCTSWQPIYQIRSCMCCSSPSIIKQLSIRLELRW